LFIYKVDLEFIRQFAIVEENHPVLATFQLDFGTFDDTHWNEAVLMRFYHERVLGAVLGEFGDYIHATVHNPRGMPEQFEAVVAKGVFLTEKPVGSIHFLFIVPRSNYLELVNFVVATILHAFVVKLGNWNR
jgi:hypothetical protein